MELIECVATSHFDDSKLGSISRKQRLFLDRSTFERLQGIGLVKALNPTATAASVPQSTAPQVVGGGESSASLQAAPASQPTTVNGPPAIPIGDSLLSTTPGSEPPSQTPSTPVTVAGGMSTTPKSPLSLRGKSGPKTKQPGGATR